MAKSKTPTKKAATKPAKPPAKNAAKPTKAAAKSAKAAKPASKPAAGAKPKSAAAADAPAAFATLIEQVKALDYHGASEAAKLVQQALPLVEKLPAAQQAAAWEQLHASAHVWNTKVALTAARGLSASEPKAPANVRALRLAKVAAAEQQVKKADGYSSFQQALKLATDDETRARILLAWTEGEHDQVTPLAAALDALDLADAGKLSPALASEIWDKAAVGLVYTTNAKAEKAQAKLLAERGKTSRDDIARDACRRWIAANKTATARSPAIVSTLSQGLISSGAVDDGLALFKEWTPKVVSLHEQGALQDIELYDFWFGGHERALRQGDRTKEAAEVTKQMTKLRGY